MRGVKLGVAGRSLWGLQLEASWLLLTEVQGDTPCPELAPTVICGRNPVCVAGGQVSNAGWERMKVFQQWELSFFFPCSNKIYTDTVRAEKMSSGP